MAHEFAHYEGAIGPEGTRRTVTYYGPVIGGLPIQAWHCEQCGLLRLAFPDGRTEERHLYPGPQPGLLALPAAVAPEHELYGLQARVSGLSAQPAYIERLVQQSAYGDVAPALRFPQITIPDWSGLTWLTVIGLTGICVLLFVMAVAAVYTYSTPNVLTPLAIIVALTFAGLIVLHAGAALIRHAFPVEHVTPSVAETLRGEPQLDTAARVVVTLLVLTIAFLFIGAILAVYTYSTPGAEAPVFILSIVCALGAAAAYIGKGIYRHFTRR